MFEVKRLCLDCRHIISLLCSLVFSLFNGNLIIGELQNVRRDRTSTSKVIFSLLGFQWLEKEAFTVYILLLLDRMIESVNKQIQTLIFRGINKFI